MYMIEFYPLQRRCAVIKPFDACSRNMVDLMNGMEPQSYPVAFSETEAEAHRFIELFLDGFCRMNRYSAK